MGYYWAALSLDSLNRTRAESVFESPQPALRTKQEAEREHEQLLDALAVAARGGQVAEIKAGALGWIWVEGPELGPDRT